MYEVFKPVGYMDFEIISKSTACWSKWLRIVWVEELFGSDCILIVTCLSDAWWNVWCDTLNVEFIVFLGIINYLKNKQIHFNSMKKL